MEIIGIVISMVGNYLNFVVSAVDGVENSLIKVGLGVFFYAAPVIAWLPLVYTARRVAFLFPLVRFLGFLSACLSVVTGAYLLHHFFSLGYIWGGIISLSVFSFFFGDDGPPPDDPWEDSIATDPKYSSFSLNFYNQDDY